MPPNNVYICSTVRHLLFALCRAIYEHQQIHHIVFFQDYQDASLDGWNLTDIPENIHVHLLLRADIRKHLQATLAGKASYLCAMRKIPAPGWLRKPLIQTLQSIDKELAAALVNEPFPRLWLFNERNKMARIFRLLVPTFSNIEEGEGNYVELSLPWYKYLPRMLKGRPAHYRVMGDNPNCNEIWVLHPENLPSLVHEKGRQIDFLDNPEIVNVLKRVFGANFFAYPPDTVILATQPLDGLPGLNLKAKQRIYAQIVDYIESHGRTILLKNHPSENTADYESLSEKIILAHNKIPVEALLLGLPDTRVLVSVFSTAGLGFEKFCRRIKLCNGEYSHTMAAMQTWADNPNELASVLDAQLKQALTED